MRPISLVILTLFLFGCSGGRHFRKPLNYLATRCEKAPQINVFVWPGPKTCPMKGKAILYFQAQGLPSSWQNFFGRLVVRAFQQEGVFSQIILGAAERPPLKVLARQGFDFAVIIDQAHFLFPTKTAPGELAFDMEILSTGAQPPLWSLTASRVICPEYPVSYGGVYLSRGRLPGGDTYAVERALFQAAREVARFVCGRNDAK